MSTSLLNRLDRLESRLLPSAEDAPSLMWISFVEPGTVDLQRHVLSATCDGQTFVRGSNESAARFQDRVDAETRLETSSMNGRVVLLESEAVPRDQRSA